MTVTEIIEALRAAPITVADADALVAIVSEKIGKRPQSRRNVCKRKHPLTGPDADVHLYVDRNGNAQRVCRACRRLTQSHAKKPPCICGHAYEAHNGGECYHEDKRKQLDCECTKYRRAADCIHGTRGACVFCARVERKVLHG